MDQIIRAIEKERMRTDLPDIHIGDTVKVWVKVIEGTRERLQGFEGYVIARKGSGLSETITVRRVSFGVGIERTFPSTRPRLPALTSCAAARSAVRSSTSCVTAWAKRRNSKKNAKHEKDRIGGFFILAYCRKSRNAARRVHKAAIL